MIELNRTFFKRLVKLYLATFAISIFAVLFELLVYPGWEFSEAFDELTARHFQPVVSDDIWMPIAGVAILAQLAGAVGLLRLKRWARTLFFWPLLVFSLVDVMLLSPPVPFTPLSTLVTFLASALWGAVVLLAYSREHGGRWFADELATDPSPHDERI